jgi:hypothetical protein
MTSFWFPKPGDTLALSCGTALLVVRDKYRAVSISRWDEGDVGE